MTSTYEPVLFKNNKKKMFREHIKTPDWIKNPILKMTKKELQNYKWNNLKMTKKELQNYKWNNDLNIEKRNIKCSDCTNCTNCTNCSNCTFCTDCYEKEQMEAGLE